MQDSVPHTEPVELYYNSLSVECQMVRNCLAEKKIAYKLHDIETVFFSSKEVATLLKVNPNAALPVLVHEGHPVVETDQIIAYIDHKFNGPKLLPENPSERANVIRWLQLCSLGPGPPNEDGTPYNKCPLGSAVHWLNMPVDVIVDERVPLSTIFSVARCHPNPFPVMNKLIRCVLWKFWRPTKVPTRPVARAAFAGITVCLKELEALLSDGRRYVSPSSFTLADVFVAANFNRLEAMGILDQMFKVAGDSSANGQDCRNIREYWSRLKRREHFASCFRPPATTRGHKEVERAIAIFRKEVLARGVVAAFKLEDEQEEEEEEQ